MCAAAPRENWKIIPKASYDGVSGDSHIGGSHRQIRSSQDGMTFRIGAVDRQIMGRPDDGVDKTRAVILNCSPIRWSLHRIHGKNFVATKEVRVLNLRD